MPCARGDLVGPFASKKNYIGPRILYNTIDLIGHLARKKLYMT
jgi:hypothetical protein